MLPPPPTPTTPATSYIKIHGFAGGSAEVFQGQTSTVTVESPVIDVEVPEPTSPVPPVEPVPTPLADAIEEFRAFFDAQIENIELQRKPVDRSLNKEARAMGRELPAIPGSGGLPDLLKAIMLFMPSWIAKYYVIADQLAPYVRAVKDAVDVGRGIRQFFVGTDFENAFLEPYAWYDIFKLWPESKLDKINKSIEGIGGDSEALKGIVDALKEIADKEGRTEGVIDVGYAKFYTKTKIVEY